jgi:hypothetical protein
MQFSSASCHFIPFRYEIFSETLSALKKFHYHKTTDKIKVLYILVFT